MKMVYLLKMPVAREICDPTTSDPTDLNFHVFALFIVHLTVWIPHWKKCFLISDERRTGRRRRMGTNWQSSLTLSSSPLVFFSSCPVSHISTEFIRSVQRDSIKLMRLLFFKLNDKFFDTHLTLFIYQRDFEQTLLVSSLRLVEKVSRA